MDTTLQVFYAALCREAHILSAHPELCWQQIYNQVQWNSPEIRQKLDKEYQKRTISPSAPWLHTQMPFRESRFLVRTLAGHSRAVNTCVVSRDGKTVASGSDDRSVKVWDLATGQLQLTLIGGGSPVTTCALSTDGAQLMSADLSGAVYVWSLATGELQFKMTVGCAIYGCDLGPDDHLLATACADGLVRLWELQSGSVARELRGHEKEVHDCKFTPDGRQLVSAGEDGQLRLWNVSTGSQVACLKPELNSSLRSCTVSRSGKLVAAVNEQAVMTVWEIDSRMQVCKGMKSVGHHPFYWGAPGRSGVLGCAIHPNEKLVISPAYDRTLTVWEIASGKGLAALEGHTGWVKACAMTPDGNFLVSAGSDNNLLVWDLSSLQASGSFTDKVRYQPVNGCAFSPDGWRAASTSEEGSVTVWDLNQNAKVKTLFGQHDLNCAIDPDGELVVTTSKTNTLAVSDLTSGTQVTTLFGHDVLEYPFFGVYACSFSSGGKLLASAGGDKTLKIWDTAEWESIGTLQGHSAIVFGCAISPSGTEVVSASQDGTVRIWDLPSFTERAILSGHKGPVYCCAVSPDGRFILSGGGGGTISKDFNLRLWDLPTQRLLGVLVGHSGPVRGCAFSPDGAFCLSVSTDATLKVWDIRSLTNVATFFLSGEALCVGVHSWRPVAGCGDKGGNFFLLDLAGVELGPIIITALDTGAGDSAILRCPRCRGLFFADPTQLGRVTTCTTEGCGLHLRVNDFVSRV